MFSWSSFSYFNSQGVPQPVIDCLVRSYIESLPLPIPPTLTIFTLGSQPKTKFGTSLVTRLISNYRLTTTRPMSLGPMLRRTLQFTHCSMSWDLVRYLFPNNSTNHPSLLAFLLMESSLGLDSGTFYLLGMQGHHCLPSEPHPMFFPTE